MPYYADLTKFSHPDRDAIPGHAVVTVGWLDELHSFETGTVSDEILDKILRLAKKPVLLTRGIHTCPFCPSPIKYSFIRERCGNGSIVIAGENDEFYHAPVMIYHYIKTHHYRPPEEFLHAVARLQL